MSGTGRSARHARAFPLSGCSSRPMHTGPHPLPPGSRSSRGSPAQLAILKTRSALSGGEGVRWMPDWPVRVSRPDARDISSGALTEPILLSSWCLGLERHTRISKPSTPGRCHSPGRTQMPVPGTIVQSSSWGQSNPPRGRAQGGVRSQPGRRRLLDCPSTTPSSEGHGVGTRTGRAYAAESPKSISRRRGSACKRAFSAETGFDPRARTCRAAAFILKPLLPVKCNRRRSAPS